MKYSFLNDNKLPVVIEPGAREHGSEDIRTVAAGNRGVLDSFMLRHGALLFRGFRIDNIPQFASFARTFAGRELLDYVGGASPRLILGDRVYTSTEYPADIVLPAHNELSYTSQWPEYRFFFCITPPRIGGETPIGDSRRILNSIDAEIVERFRSRRIRYDRFLENCPASQYSWQAAFETEDTARVEECCLARGIRFRWHPDGSLHLTETRPATALHPRTGEEAWFNQADGFHPSALGITAADLSSNSRLRLGAHFGDGGEIDVADLEQIRTAIRSELILFPWMENDVLVVDNVLACHGRMPFSGPRKIVLAMA